MRKAEIAIGIGAIVLALVFIVVAGSFPEARGRDYGMAFYPRILGGLIIILSLIMMYEGHQKAKRAESERVRLEELFDTKEGGIRRVLIMIGLTLVYAATVRFLGFLVITPIYLIVLMLVFGAGKFRKITIISLVTTLIIYLAFQRLLRIPLPTGIFYN